MGLAVQRERRDSCAIISIRCARARDFCQIDLSRMNYLCDRLTCNPLPRMRWAVFTAAALLILAMTMLAAGCGQDTEPTAIPTATSEPAPPPTSTSAPTNVTGTAIPPTTAPTDSPTATSTPDSAPTDPSEAYFALDHVLDIKIEIAAEDWDTLRHQTRTFEDVIAEIERYNLSRPFANIYTWFSASVTVDGETYSDVGVRKKGFLGSQSETKPALKLRFDKYVDGQSLGGVIERMTLNNSVQDPSMVNTCLAYRVFSAAGSPSPRCNFATVAVNGKSLGLYVHVEEIKKPFLARHFDSAEGNLYEGTVSDFTPDFRGTIEKKTNEDEDDWSDIDAVVAALQDPSDAGLEALADAVDLDRFLSFWATEVLVGHWDGYAGDRNNYHFYREPDGPFVFIPWGVDDTFHLKDDPNPFDEISDPPPSVLALTAIPNRLYNNTEWRLKYVGRLKELLDSAWNEDQLLASVDQMAAIVQQHALPEAKAAAAEDTGRVKKFNLKRRGEILADITPEPPDWPEPMEEAAEASGAIELSFNTTWGSNRSANPFAEGMVTSLRLDENEESTEGIAVLAGHSSPEEAGLLPGAEDLASIAAFGVEPDGSVSGLTIVLPRTRLTGGAKLVIGEDAIAGGLWTIPAGDAIPDSFTPFTAGALELSEAGTEPSAAISGSFTGYFGWAPPPADGGTAIPAADTGLVINEVASKGDPLDWFELYNASEEEIDLAGYLVADDLTDAAKRVAFPAGLVIQPGEYLQIALDKDGWPGFALGGDEELGIWTADGAPVDEVDWDEGQAGEGMSYARVPDATGDFQTVDSPTPGASNNAGS